jgi:sulfur carrier protein
MSFLPRSAGSPGPPNLEIRAHVCYFDCVRITLNGEPYELPGPLTVSQLLARLAIDARRVAIELNLIVVKRATFDSTTVGEGDHVEIVNFVGGG